MKTKKKISAADLDKKFDAGEDVSDYVDFDQGTRTVNIELPLWAIKALDRESTRRGVARQALMKMWLVDRLDALQADRAGKSPRT